MNRGKYFRPVILIFVVVLVGYGVLFAWIGHRRVAKGPWVVAFVTEYSVPTLIIDQSKLGIRNVRILLADERLTTNVVQTLEFSEARSVPFDVPFGKCVFLDPLFLPGTVALEMFGHEIQLMPRVLTIDQVERPWHSGETIELRKQR
jgi:hypothetical protein